MGDDVKKDAKEIIDGVVYTVIRCPRCRSRRTLAYCVRGEIQHRKCNDCGLGFKAVRE